jgi:hypothetical protein
MLSTLWAVCSLYHFHLRLSYQPVFTFVHIAAAAEKALEITRSLIDLAKIENGLSKSLTVYARLPLLKPFPFQ